MGSILHSETRREEEVGRKKRGRHPKDMYGYQWGSKGFSSIALPRQYILLYKDSSAILPASESHTWISWLLDWCLQWGLWTQRMLKNTLNFLGETYLYPLLSVENKATRILISYCIDNPMPILSVEKWEDVSGKNSRASESILLESFLKSHPPRAL